ncbi:MAG: O-acetylhomoserine sulfhydrylase / O-succinylhomoserine sulfhydrylase [Ktedonobacterales bacterium]|nr:MAG: O-acetylhomoserine sulfhydrylase / O-succinylhomoserine sulfhydrylase [Ktedonobacterales bacterium]
MLILNTNSQMHNALIRHRRIAVVGFSDKPTRPSHEIAIYLIEQGYDVYLVNPILAGQRILDHTVYSSLRALPQPPEVVDVFRRSEYVSEIMDEAISIGAKVVWMQLGVKNDEAAERGHAAGLIVIQNRCILVEHARLNIGNTN